MIFEISVPELVYITLHISSKIFFLKFVIQCNQPKDLAFSFKLSYISALCDLYKACYNENYEGVGSVNSRHRRCIG